MLLITQYGYFKYLFSQVDSIHFNIWESGLRLVDPIVY